MAKAASALAGERLRIIIEAIGDELGHEYGWQSEVARRLRISQSTVNQVLRGDRGVGMATTTNVSRALNLRPQWFTDRSLRSRDYRDYLDNRPPNDAEESPAWRAFLHATDLGRRLSEGKILGPERDRALMERLKQYDFSALGIADPSLYEDLARRVLAAEAARSHSSPPR